VSVLVTGKYVIKINFHPLKIFIIYQHGFPPGARGNDKVLGFLRFVGSKIKNQKSKIQNPKSKIKIFQIPNQHG
jgi:hypothetical protein